MTNEVSNLTPALPASRPDHLRTLRYLVMAIGANALFWGGANYLAKDAPRVYTSQWSIIPLSGAPRANVSLPNIGLAESRTDSPFSKEQDIKESYKVIATTEVVRKTAAAKVGMTSGQFGKPRIEIVEGTALMNFEMPGNTPEEAQKKAFALHEAFQERLNQLRIQQAAEQEAGFENSLSVARKKLETAQIRLSDYKVRSGLSSKDQVEQLAGTIEALRRQRAEILAQQQEAGTRAQRLANNMQASSRVAADAFALRADPVFQQYLSDYSDVTAALTTASSKFGPNHPIVVRDTQRLAAVRSALQERGQAVLGRPMDGTTLSRLSLGKGDQVTAREDVFKNIVTSEAEQQGFAARAREIDRQMLELEQRLSVLAQRSSTLEALNRDMQIAEAVFSSTLAGLDASKADLFGAYPPVQVVAEPTLPGEATVPQKQSLKIGAVAASALVTLALLLLWLRKTSLVKHFLLRRNAPSTI